MSQQEDDLRALAKIMDFLRAVSIILVVMNVYWFCYEAIRLWGVNIGVVDKILLNFDRTAGLFHSILYTKLFSVLLLALSCLGTKGVKGEKITWGRIWTAFAVGFVLFFLNWWLLPLPLPLEAVTGLYVLTIGTGYVCLLMGGLWMSRLLKHNLMEDVFNNENESFMQETRLIESEYSVNLPTRFYYRKRWNNGWINVVNPFRASIVLGTPGSGKSYAVVNNFIKQQIEKGFSQYIYDFKYPDLSTIAYNHLLNHPDGYKVKPKFYVINFDDPRRSHRCNPIHPDFMEDITDAYESAVSPCYRVSEPPLRGYISDTDLLSGAGELPFAVHGCVAWRGCGAAHGSDSVGKNPAFEDDFTAALLGDVRQRVYAGHQQSRRAENPLRG